MIRALMIALALAAMPAMAGGRAAAQERAWCLYETASDGGGAINCGFHSFGQCQASRPGGSSHCVPNPALAASRSSTNGSQTGHRERRR
jgi:Protein of unknown function (DUF3551)